MINNIVFLNDHWFLPISLGAIIFLAVFIGKELAVSGRRRLFIKIPLILFALFSLALIALKPAFPTAETTGKFVLLTKGYNEDQLDSLRKEHRRLEVVEYKPGQAVSEEIISTEKVFVLGHGLKPYDLGQLDKVPAIYLGGNAIEGVVKLKIQPENGVGDSLFLKGLYKNPRFGIRMVLQGPGGVGLDSLILDAEEDRQFKLAAELKVPGNFIYTLTQKDSVGNILTSDPVPVKVTEKEKLKILIINSFPTFETKYLKNFLAEAGHELVVRSQITRGRFKFEYFNTDRTAVRNLSKTTLELFDLLIIDAGSWRNLPRGQAMALENSIRENGLGVFIQPDDIFLRSPGSMADLGFERVQQSDISFSQWPGIKLPRFPYEIRDEMGLQKIHTKSNSVLSGYKRLGQGRIGTSVLSDTWQLVLEGNSEVYKHLWAKIIEQVSKKENPLSEWEQEALIVYPHEPFHFKLRTNLEDPEIKNGEGNVIPMIQDINISSLWKGTTWPKEAGWNRLQQDTTSIFDYYVAPEDAWNSVTEYQTGETNRRHFKHDEKEEQGERPPEPVNLLWFYGLFLICIAGLWLEPKV